MHAVQVQDVYYGAVAMQIEHGVLRHDALRVCEYEQLLHTVQRHRGLLRQHIHKLHYRHQQFGCYLLPSGVPERPALHRERTRQTEKSGRRVAKNARRPLWFIQR